MTSKNQTTSTQAKNMRRKTSHIKLISTITTFGLFVSQSAFAADEASSGGIPGWMWGVLVVAILVGVTLLPKKWTKQKKTQVPTRPPAPIAKKIETPTTVKTKTPAPAATPKVVAPAVVEVAPITVKVEPKPEKMVEVVDVLDEAKQLLAQQRFPQAVGVLNKGLQKYPARSDLMLELLAIYLKQDDHEAFNAQYEQLKKLDDPIALIQAEELHNQLERPTQVESDLIEFDTKKAIIEAPETEPTTPAVITDYSADSVAFTTEKPKAAEPEHIEAQTPDAESVSFGKTVDITPIETEFSLDDIDLVDTAAENKDSPVDISAKKQSDDFDFSDFHDFVINAPSETKSLDVATEVEPLAPTAKSADLKAPVTETSKTSDLVDLEFDLDDSFTFDEDKIEVAAKKSDWSTDLADETFAAPNEPAFKDPFAAEVLPEPVVPVPVAPPKAVVPVAKDLAATLEEEFPFLQTADTFQTRLDLARNYIALGEISSAKELLNEVAEQGAASQQTEARELIAKLAS